MNFEDGSPAVVSAVILSGGRGGIYKEEGITHGEVKQAMKRLKNKKAVGIDGVTAEILKGDVN